MVPSPCRPTQILCPVDDNEDGEGGEGKRKKKGSMDAIVESMWFESNIDNAYLSSIGGKIGDLSSMVFFNEYFLFFIR